MANRMTAAAAALVEQFRPTYEAQVEQLAQELRPRFESGELHGYRIDADYEAEHLDARGVDPIQRLTARVERALVPNAATAFLILACSRSGGDGALEFFHFRWLAAECMVVDAFRVARERGWWRPRRGEYIGHRAWERLSRRAA